MIPEEKSLLLGAKRGDTRAFSALLELYREKVTRLAFNLTGSYEDAEDVAQEAFVKAYEAIGRYDVSRPFAPWLYRIALNQCLDYLRRRKCRPQQVTFPEDTAPLDTKAGVSESPEDALVRKEAEADLLAAVHELPETYRVALVLRYLDDLSYAQIAEVLNTSVANVQMRISRARQRLRERLKQRDREDV
ncbi:MAG: RNA polymerase sigma factor [Armatimonadota bacterium]